MVRNYIKKPSTLGVISFLTGFALMAYELVAARLLAPTIGSSIYVWTSVIGIIIAALSLGYWLGGKMADARQQAIDVAVLCLLAALFVVVTIISHPNTLSWISQFIDDVRLQGVIASLLLFAPTSFILGCISPYLAKLNIKTLDTAGESVANLSALNSIGGIIGTFITGFVFFGYLGSKETLLIVIMCLIFSSWLLVPKKFLVRRVVASVVIILMGLLPTPAPSSTVARIDTPSAHYEISTMSYNSEPIVGLRTGPGGVQSAVYTDGRDELVFWYTRYAEKIIESQNPERVLVLGGGAFTLPEVLAKKLPNTTIDVVEIDPELEEISKKYFSYEEQPNVNLIFNDARSFVNTSKEKYDVIFVDVYGDSYVPFSLLTKEYGERINALLQPDGLVLMNAIVGTRERCQELVNAIDSVYRPFLPNGSWETQTGQQQARANYILAYSRSSELIDTMKLLPAKSSAPAYSDNFMPAERLHYDCRQES